MSEEIYKKGTVMVTRYYGGEFRGVCYQINDGLQYVQITTEATVNMINAIINDLVKRLGDSDE